jgi:hypothetical protein
MKNKEEYFSPELSLIFIQEDLVRTSVQSAPDVFTKDPFLED